MGRGCVGAARDDVVTSREPEMVSEEKGSGGAERSPWMGERAAEAETMLEMMMATMES